MCWLHCRVSVPLSWWDGELVRRIICWSAILICSGWYYRLELTLHHVQTALAGQCAVELVRRWVSATYNMLISSLLLHDLWGVVMLSTFVYKHSPPHWGVPSIKSWCRSALGRIVEKAPNKSLTEEDLSFNCGGSCLWFRSFIPYWCCLTLPFAIKFTLPWGLKMCPSVVCGLAATKLRYFFVWLG